MAVQLHIISALIVVFSTVCATSVDLFVSNPDKRPRAFRIRRFFNWFVCALGYVSIYTGRYNLSTLNTSATRKEIFGGITPEQFSLVLTAGQLTFGTCNLFSGFIVDAFFKGKTAYALSIAASGLANLGAAVMFFWIEKHRPNDFSIIFPVLIVFAIINYGAQSFGANSVPKINANWYSGAERGVFGGVFSIVISTGFYVGLAINGVVLSKFPAHASAVFLLPSLIQFISAFAILLFTKDAPSPSSLLSTITTTTATATATTTTTTTPSIVHRLVGRVGIATSNNKSKRKTETNTAIAEDLELDDPTASMLEDDQLKTKHSGDDDDDNNNDNNSNNVDIYNDNNESDDNNTKKIDENTSNNNNAMTTNTTTTTTTQSKNATTAATWKSRGEEVKSIVRLCLLPESLVCAFLMGCIGVLREGLLSWFSDYLEHLGVEPGNSLYSITAMGISVFGSLGGITIGFLSDRVFKGARGAALGLFYFCLSVNLAVLLLVKNTFVAAFLIGFSCTWIFGVSNMLNFVVVTDLGGAKATAAVNGLFGFTFNIGAAASNFIVAALIRTSLKYMAWISWLLLVAVVGFIVSIALILLGRMRNGRKNHNSDSDNSAKNTAADVKLLLQQQQQQREQQQQQQRDQQDQDDTVVVQTIALSPPHSQRVVHVADEEVVC